MKLKTMIEKLKLKDKFVDMSCINCNKHFKYVNISFICPELKTIIIDGKKMCENWEPIDGK